MRLKVLYLLCVFLAFLITSFSCLAGSPKPTIMKFIEKCETGDWGAAEALLSERGKLQYLEGGSLRDKFWPMLSLPFVYGVDSKTIKDKMPEFITIISADTSTNTAQVRVMIKNSLVLGSAQASTIMNQTGLKSVDLAIKFDLVEEKGRWRVEKITVQGDHAEVAKWEEMARKAPPTS